MKLWNTLPSFDEPELHAYRVYAHSLYERLSSGASEDAYMQILTKLSTPLSEVRVPCIEVSNGIKLYDIRDFVIQYPALARKYLFDASTRSWQDNQICSLIEGCWNRGMVLFIPPSIHTTTLIDIRALLAPYADAVLIEKCIVIIESHAQITLIDYVDKESIDAYCVLRAVDYKIGEYASVDIHMITQLDSSTYEGARSTIHASAKSRVTFTFFTTGTAHSTVWLDCFLHDKSASIQVRGAGVLSGQRHVTMITKQYHSGLATQSDLLIKNCLANTSSFDYTGSIHIAPQAAKTSAHQRNMNLLLHDGARASSQPSLEVLNNDVQCSHGSAVGQIDTQQIFYLQSRGLSYRQAQQCIIQGFLADLFIDVPHDLTVLYRQEALVSVWKDT